jgi:oleate hydratase
VIWGFGLRLEKRGDIIDKPMTACTGKEIMTELLNHLDMSVESILPTSITIPCLLPLATSALLPRHSKDRAEVIPNNTTNITLVGQHVEIPRDTTFNMEYSIWGAQMADYALMGLPKSPLKTKQDLLDVFDLLSEG